MRAGSRNRIGDHVVEARHVRIDAFTQDAATSVVFEPRDAIRLGAGIEAGLPYLVQDCDEHDAGEKQHEIFAQEGLAEISAARRCDR